MRAGYQLYLVVLVEVTVTYSLSSTAAAATRRGGEKVSVVCCIMYVCMYVCMYGCVQSYTVHSSSS